jgi:type IV pilus assembly protein PilM
MRFGLGLFNKKRNNLIIQDHVIRYLDMRQPELLEVKSSGERYLPEGIIQDGIITDGETLLKILEECIEEWGIKGREVHFLIPDSKLVIRKHHIPSVYKVEEIKRYLYLELGSTVHLPFEDPVFDYVLLKC